MALKASGGNWVLPVSFALFATVVAMTGGSSRPDIVWLVVLRPVTILFIVALLVASDLDWRRIAPLPFLLAAFAATMALQLVPLPPALWLGLNGRATYDAVAWTLGEAERWRPLSLSPAGTWNSLAALLSPLATMMAYVALGARQQRKLLLPMLGIVGFSMLLGLAQVAGGADSPFYWYRVSGRGQLIGLFANRNHQGALLAMALPLLRAWTLMPFAGGARIIRARWIAAAAGSVFVILYALVLGSRAGLGLTVMGVIAAFIIDPSVGPKRWSPRTRALLAAALLVGLLGLLVVALSANRAESVDRIVGSDLNADARLAALPTLLHIVRDTLPVGTGFGSFVPVWSSYEPDALLKPSYFNNAHNDLIEVAITGGVPSLAVLIAFLLWWAQASWRSVTGPAGSWRLLQRASALAILIALLASLVDYPLRTPLMGAIFTILCCWLAHRPDNKSLHDE